MSNLLTYTRKISGAVLPWLAAWRWRRASILASFLTAVAIISLNSVPYQKTFHGIGSFYGWPREFTRGYPHGNHGRSAFRLIQGTVLEFDAAELAFNIAVAVAMTAGVGLTIEYRYRRWNRKPWQFSVNELFIAALAIAGMLCWVARQNMRETVALNRLHCHFVAGSLLPDSVRRYLPETPGGWLKPLDRVHSLHIMAAARPDDYFVALEQFPAVKELAIEADFGDGALSHIARMRGLRYLSLDSPRLTGEGLANLTSLPKLRQLRVRSGRLSAAGLRQLSRFTDVEIQLVVCGVVTAAQLRELAKVSGLTTLTLSDCQLDDEVVSALSQITQINHLTLDSTRQRVEMLGRLGRLRQLSQLELQNIPGLRNDRVLADLQKQLTSGCGWIYIH